MKNEKLPDDIRKMNLEQVDSALAEIDSPEGQEERQLWLTRRDYFQGLIEERAERRVNLQKRQIELLQEKLKK